MLRNFDAGSQANWASSPDFQRQSYYSSSSLSLSLTSASRRRHFLLILACSATKRTSPGSLPAIERYDGISYRVLAKAKREGYVSLTSASTDAPSVGGGVPLDILILSARYGWLRLTDLIENYDQRMTSTRALELQPTVGPELDRMLEQPPNYQQIYLNLGQTYQLALATSTQLPLLLQHAGKVVMAQGGIGQRAAQLKSWLHNLNIS